MAAITATTPRIRRLSWLVSWLKVGSTKANVAYLKAPRGEPSGELPPYSHVLFLQNHDQVGNRVSVSD
jgi:hypothetical protein